MEDIRTLSEQYHFNVYRRFPVVIVSGKGTQLEDAEGKKYTDFVAGISVNALGYGNKDVIEAIQRQAEKLIHISNGYYSEPQTRLAEMLCRISGYDKIFFCNSGLEANEAAIKLARRFGHKHNKKGKIISFTKCFHGRSIASITMGGEKYQKGFGPLPEGFLKLPYNDPGELKNHIHEDTIAVFVEPVQGEGGVIPAESNFLEDLEKSCRKNNVLLICDEIQTGLGRTGKLFGHQHYNIHPDIITIAKSLGGGIPLGAVIAKSKVAELLTYGDHGSTFGGNPLACSAALASLNIIMSNGFLDKVRETGEYFIDQLNKHLKGIPGVKEIRGRGLMIGVELEYPGRPVVEKMLEKGFLINCTAEKTLRFLPPLIIGITEIDSMILNLKDCLLNIE